MNKKLRKKAGESSFYCFVDAQGRYADFHALRGTFIVNLSKSGVSPKMAQRLARHSDINLTMNVYTDVVLEDQAVAVELLPELPTLLTTPAPIKPPCFHQHLAKMRERAAQNKVAKQIFESTENSRRKVPNVATSSWLPVPTLKSNLLGEVDFGSAAKTRFAEFETRSVALSGNTFKLPKRRKLTQKPRFESTAET